MPLLVPVTNAMAMVASPTMSLPVLSAMVGSMRPICNAVPERARVSPARHDSGRHRRPKALEVCEFRRWQPGDSETRQTAPTTTAGAARRQCDKRWPAAPAERTSSHHAVVSCSPPRSTHHAAAAKTMGKLYDALNRGERWAAMTSMRTDQLGRRAWWGRWGPLPAGRRKGGDQHSEHNFSRSRPEADRRRAAQPVCLAGGSEATTGDKPITAARRWWQLGERWNDDFRCEKAHGSRPSVRLKQWCN